MERESTGTKYMAANCEGSRSPPRAGELRMVISRQDKQQVQTRSLNSVSPVRITADSA
jgi:hypothetical protein